MKNYLFILIATMLAGCFGKDPTITTGKEGKPMPAFNLLLMDSTTRLNTIKIPPGKPVVLFLFNPYCPYCKAQTKAITDQIKSLSSIRFYLFSIYSFNEIKEYYGRFELNRYSNITVGVDYEDFFGKYFEVPGVPYMAIYDKEKRLKKVLIGKVGIDLIKETAF